MSEELETTITVIVIHILGLIALYFIAPIALSLGQLLRYILIGG